MERISGILIISLICSYSIVGAEDIYSPDNDARLDPKTTEIRKSSEVGDEYHTERNTYNAIEAGPLSNQMIEQEMPGNTPIINAETNSAEPNNTSVNRRDRNGSTLTPMDQSLAPADVTITQQVRKAITSDNSLSINADNIKIITISGIVTLRGVVEDENEKILIESKARGIPKVIKILNELEVTQVR